MPLLTVFSIALNTVALVLTLGVLLLTVWQRPADRYRRALVDFLVACFLWVASTLSLQVAVGLRASDDAFFVLTNFTVSGFALTTLAAFSLIVSAADAMRKGYAVIARTGAVLWLLFQLPLWRGTFFPVYLHAPPGARLDIATPIALYAALAALAAQGLTAWVAYRHPQRIANRALVAGLLLLQTSNALMFASGPARELMIGTWITAPVAVLLGYGLLREDFVNPLVRQTRQLHRLRDVARALAAPQNPDEVAAQIARQAVQLLNTDTALLFWLTGEAELEIIASVGSVVRTRQHLEPGQGLAGQVIHSGEPLCIRDYTTWDGKAEWFHERTLYAALCVPLIYDGEVVGVLTVGEQRPHRAYSEEDQALLEMLALQGTSAIVLAGAAPHRSTPDAPR